MNNGDLDWLMHWYCSQCDGDWEHSNGVEVGTLDNPGWFLKVSLSGTELFDKDFDVVDINKTKDNWIYCEIKNEVFEGFGGPFNLIDILRIFRDLAEN